MYYQPRATNSVQRNVPIRHMPLIQVNSQYLSPQQIYQPKSEQETNKEQLDNLYINLRKENQTLKDKLQHLTAQVEEAQQRLQKYKQQQ